MENKHFHTLEIAILGVFVTAVGFHAFRFVGGKMSTSANPAIAKTGAALAGVFTFGGGAGR